MSKDYVRLGSTEGAEWVVDAERALEMQDLGCITAKELLSNVAANLTRRSQMSCLPDPTVGLEVAGFTRATLGTIDHVPEVRKTLNKFVVGVLQTNGNAIAEAKQRRSNELGTAL